MSTSKLNPDKTEFIIFGLNKLRDKLKAFFRLISWATHSALQTQSKIWVCGSIQTFLCPSMFKMSAKVVLSNSVISDMSGSFLLMIFLYLWLMLLLVVGCITATELYLTPVDTLLCITPGADFTKGLKLCPFIG